MAIHHRQFGDASGWPRRFPLVVLAHRGLAFRSEKCGMTLSSGFHLSGEESRFPPEKKLDLAAGKGIFKNDTYFPEPGCTTPTAPGRQGAAAMVTFEDTPMIAHTILSRSLQLTLALGLCLLIALPGPGAEDAVTTRQQQIADLQRQVQELSKKIDELRRMDATPTSKSQ